MTTPAFRRLLDEAKDAHVRLPDLAQFCAFADDLVPAEWDARRIPAAELMCGDPAMAAPDVDPLAKAFLGASGDAFWRLTYEGTSIGKDFMDRFGCYCLIGPDAPWVSRKMAAFVVYMPPNLDYTWHHHPAEEIYQVLAGEATFYREGKDPHLVSQGGSSFHASNQPHATKTGERGFMAYVAWRNELDVAPVLTDRPILGYEENDPFSGG